MGMYNDLSGGTSVVHPLHGSTILFTANDIYDSLRCRVAKADMHEPCAGLREESEVRPKAGAVNVRQTNDGLRVRGMTAAEPAVGVS